MPKESVYVVPHPGGWAVRMAGAAQVSFVHSTQSGAFAVARATAVRLGTDVIVHDRDRRVLRHDDYGTKTYPVRW